MNNAGVGLEAQRPKARVHETEEDMFDITMRVNTKSVFLGCKYAIRQMLAQEPHASGDRGWIINISSIMSLIAGNCNRESNPIQKVQQYHRANTNSKQHHTVHLKEQ